MKGNELRPMLLIGRYAAVGALMGLLAGVLEGLYKLRYPCQPFFLKPSVSYVILFLGPLLNALAGGFIGTVTGLFVASLSGRIWRRIALILGICLVAMLILAIAKDPGYAVVVLMGPYPARFSLTMMAGILLGGWGACIVGRLLPLRTLSILLAVVFAVLLLGVGVYAIRPSMHRAGVAAKPPGPAGKPNIILITLDTVRADHLSLYGYPRRTTPSIDKWARQGTVFENAIAASSWTLPSHASIFTGLLPHQHGANSTRPLDPSWWTLGEVLSSRGYETAGFTSNLDYGGIGWGMGNGFELYDDDGTSVRHNMRALLLGSVLLQPFFMMYVHPEPMDRRDARQINRDVLRWFQHRSPKPFYLFINYYDVHDPYVMPAYYPSRFGQVSPWLIHRIESDLGEDGKGHISAEDKEALIASYDNCLAFLDDSVDELLYFLSCLPGWENTIVIITSDHGEGFGEHGTYGHGANLYREAVRVPLMILGPNVPAGFRISRLVGIQEIFETVLELSGMDNPPFQRASLQRFWRPGFEPGGFNEFVLSELSQASISLTTPEWQYLRDVRGNEELYHWVSDPGERSNVGKSPEYQKILEDLQIQLGATVTNSLRPWEGQDYLSALGGSERYWAEVARLSPEPDSSSAHPPRIPMGTSQAFFPRRASTSTQRPPSADQELLRSLPYH